MKINRLLVISSLGTLLIGVLIGHLLPHAPVSVPAAYTAQDVVSAISANGGDTSSESDGETLEAYLGIAQQSVTTSSSATL